MSIYKRASGRYAVLVERDSSGARKRRSLGTFATRKEAERAEREALTARDRGIEIASSKITLGQLFERFMQTRAHDHSPTTIYGYNAAWKRCATIANVQVDKLRPAHLSELYASLATSGRHDGAPLSPKSLGHTAALVSALLRWAVDLDIVPRNVAAVKAARPVSRPRKRARAYDAADAARLVTEAQKTRYGPLVILAFTTGLRRGELAGLKWSDIDFERATATIARAAVKIPRQPLVIKDTKTHLVASIALSPLAIEALRRQRAIQAEDRLAAGGYYVDRGYVFAGPAGEILSPDAIASPIRRIAARIGLSERGLHAMRHSTASWMIREGADIRTVQAVLRHSTASTTLNTYAHEVEGAQAAAVAHLDGYLIEKIDVAFGTDGNRMATVTPLAPKKRRKTRAFSEPTVGLEPPE